MSCSRLENDQAPITVMRLFAAQVLHLAAHTCLSWLVVVVVVVADSLETGKWICRILCEQYVCRENF